MKNPLIPFLAITGSPSKEQIENHLQMLKKVGIDQFLLYPRSGCELEYLSEKWFETIGYYLEFAKQNGVKIALATSSPFERAKEHLESVGLFKYFDEFACGSMVKNSKPKPDIYLLACEKLNLKPEECIALEDSPNGVISASTAGCATIMVPDLDKPTEDLIPLLYSVCDNLSCVIPLL